MRIHTFVGLLLLAAAPAGAAPPAVVRAEREVEAPVYGATDAEQELPRLACHAAGCLLVWRDSTPLRADRTPSIDTRGRLWGARLLPDGAQQEQAPILLGGDQPVGGFDVASDGKDFLVVWTAAGPTLGAARVDGGSGAVTPTARPSALPANAYHGWKPALSFGGDRYLATVSLDSWTSPGEVRGALLDRQGTAAADSFTIASGADVTGFGSSSAFTGQRFVVVWAGQMGSARGARVGGDGAVLDAGGFEVTALGKWSHQPRLAWGGGRLLLVAGGFAGYEASAIDAVLLDADGRNPTRVTLPSWFDGQGPIEPHAAWNGSHFLITWSAGTVVGGRQAVAARLAPDGTVLDPAGLVLSSTEPFATTDQPRAAAVGTGFQVVFEDSRASLRRLARVGVSEAGTVAPAGATPAVKVANRQVFLAAGHAAGTNLLVWADERDGYQAASLRAARVADDGTLLDAQPLVLSSTAAERLSAQVIEGAGGFVVIWRDRMVSAAERTWAARVPTAGAVPAQPVEIPLDLGTRVTAASNGMGVLLAWGEGLGGIGVRRLDGGLQAIGADLSLGGSDGGPPLAALGIDGSTLLVWTTRFKQGEGVAARVGADGTVTTMAPGGRLPLPVNVATPSDIALASDGTRALLFWGGSTVLALPRAGSLDGLAPSIETAFSYPRQPSWDGLFFSDATSRENMNSGSATLLLDRRTPEASPLPSEPVLAASLPLANPAAIGLGQGRVLLAYSRLVAGESRGTFRVRYQLLDNGAAPPGGGSPADGGVVDGAPSLDADAGMSALDAPAAAGDAAIDGPGDAPGGAAVEAGSARDGGPLADGPALATAHDGGCSCRLGNRSPGFPSIGWLLAAGVVLARAGRRRRHRSPKPGASEIGVR